MWDTINILKRYSACRLTFAVWKVTPVWYLVGGCVFGCVVVCLFCLLVIVGVVLVIQKPLKACSYFLRTHGSFGSD
jgi:uncharacterized membrane protein